MFLPPGWSNSPCRAKVTVCSPSVSLLDDTDYKIDHKCTVKDLADLSHGKTANNPTSQGNPEEVVVWRKSPGDLFSSCFGGGGGGEDIPITTFLSRVQLTLLRNRCLFFTQSAPSLPGKLGEIQQHPQHSPVGTETHPCLCLGVGEEGRSVACGGGEGYGSGFAASSWRCY